MAPAGLSGRRIDAVTGPMPFSENAIFATVFENSPDTVIVVDAGRTIVAVNPAFTELFGFGAQEVVGKCGSMLYADRADFEVQGRLRYNPEAPAIGDAYVNRYRRKSGEAFWAEVRGRQVRDGDGRLHGYVGLVRDIDGQVRLQDLLRSVITLASDHEADAETVVREFLRIGSVYFDLEVATVTGIEDGMVYVDHALDPEGRIAPGQSYAQETTFCDAVIRSGGVQSFSNDEGQGLADHPAYHAFGFESYIGAPLGYDGDLLGTLAFMGRRARGFGFSGEDETLIRLLAGWLACQLGQRSNRQEREALSDRLARSARRFEWLYRHTPAMLHSIDTSARLVEVSDCWLEQMGYASRDEVIGRPVTNFLTDDSRAFAEREVLPRFWRTGAVKDVPYEFLRKDGTTFEVELSAIVDPGELESGHSLAVIYDVTARNRALRELKARNAELRQLNEELERFAFAASHDLQEPLRKIQMFSRYLQEDVGAKLSGDGTYALEVMRDATGRMRRLIEDLLAYSQAAHEEPVMDPVDLDGVLAAVLDDLTVQVEEAKAKVDVQPLPEVRCDETLARQLFQNLLSNALKYRHPTRPCRIRVAAVEDAQRAVWRVVVQDNGIGFDADDAERIFQPFQRLHGRSSFGGTGFGLSICKRIAERHGWSIAAEAVPDEGATFTVDVSASPPEGRHSRKSSTPATITAMPTSSGQFSLSRK